MNKIDNKVNYFVGGATGAAIGYFSGVVFSNKYKVHLAVLGAILGAVLYKKMKDVKS